MITWEHISTSSYTHPTCLLPSTCTRMCTATCSQMLIHAVSTCIHMCTATCSQILIHAVGSHMTIDLKHKRIKLVFFLLTHVLTIKRTGRDLWPRTGRGSGLHTGADTGLSLWVGCRARQSDGSREEAEVSSWQPLPDSILRLSPGLSSDWEALVKLASDLVRVPTGSFQPWS